ncbi:hypothetical protein COS31_00200 [Candidatus Roizmanbacteria bacterium CG02_land_8_20_14_3_00_36_15]|uniref:PIN domain-containing protein n=2 Tax=Candidatus Roizmaniibacteriota TaxID=1752723 RepID=A0A2M8KK05_9BACT|nr:MAG: hypothetical protein COS51_04995 [Candidatus Roizmanbacteria bacterium CG03_land_8_20_14_0_80_36_21]PIV38285.1 MAG: hypothetical protein COS31_00200 [Candidatus Roizmanbacteria bacterium CG02_land_8_20_14_3_00_36_15]PIY70046.1 MAG: hypothetical protein COY89_03200 [Candidatus Roizmanbacteria bacterium CG_4_10_14_0_8_um_filter_36_36]PJA52725.1 MAG: hypothetical protein CO166_04520 [Candidatus Roizmanbacteria bacterium CG_4_9_14_3_um_filter_36_11]PJC81614.1 MAG: hypothetical protein CO007
MSYLVDSDVVIDFLNKIPTAVNFFKKNLNSEILLSVISWLEIVYGFKKSNSVKKLKLFQEFIRDNQIVTLPVDEKMAGEYLNLRISLEEKKVPLSDFDLLIAATAFVNNLTLVTRNTKHFKRIKKLKLFI